MPSIISRFYLDDRVHDNRSNCFLNSKQSPKIEVLPIISRIYLDDRIHENRSNYFLNSKHGPTLEVPSIISRIYLDVRFHGNDKIEPMIEYYGQIFSVLSLFD